MKHFFIFLIVVSVIGAVAYFVYKFINKKINDTILKTSPKIDALLKLNETVDFHVIPPCFSVLKHYDNKGNYNKIDPAYIMTAEVRRNIPYYSDYIKKIHENREIQKKYDCQVSEIFSKEYPVDFKALKISERTYRERENKFFNERKLNLVTDCRFVATMTYSSPQGRVNLTKSTTLYANDIEACIESISRSRLDKKTYAGLAAVERGEISDSLRYDILNRDGFKCVICGATARQGARLHVDHIIPVSKGGKSVPENLRTLCERCNIGKGAKIEGGASSIRRSQPKEEEDQICGWCGAKLVLRCGSLGEFYGCSNYPRCRFTKNIK
ncbi:MAG: HNH endonuclease [Clostridia bacterium]|nr:HNH endonuclease [Clostridia bacterium]